MCVAAAAPAGSATDTALGGGSCMHAGRGGGVGEGGDLCTFEVGAGARDVAELHKSSGDRESDGNAVRVLLRDFYQRL